MLQNAFATTTKTTNKQCCIKYRFYSMNQLVWLKLPPPPYGSAIVHFSGSYRTYFIQFLTSTTYSLIIEYMSTEDKPLTTRGLLGSYTT